MFDSNSVIVWAAGLFEGEGHISVRANGVRAMIVMTDLDVLETFKTNFGGTLLKQKIRKGKEHWKSIWKWPLTCFRRNPLPFRQGMNAMSKVDHIYV